MKYLIIIILSVLSIVMLVEIGIPIRVDVAVITSVLTIFVMWAFDIWRHDG